MKRRELLKYIGLGILVPTTVELLVKQKKHTVAISNNDEGGFIVPEEYREQMIEFFKNKKAITHVMKVDTNTWEILDEYTIEE